MLVIFPIVLFLMWFTIGCCIPLKVFTEYLNEDKTRKIKGIDIFVITFSGVCGPFGFIGSLMIIREIKGTN